ncbi:MAG: hypothetical protein U1F20_01650 [Lysobacterales bacterium]
MPAAKRSTRIFGPGEVGEDADLAAEQGLAHEAGARFLRRQVAVREIEPDHVDAGFEQAFEHARRIGRGAQRGEDLGAAAAFGHGMLSPVRTLAQPRDMATARRIDIAATLATLPAFPQLRGKRVRLRRPTESDADALFALFSDRGDALLEPRADARAWRGRRADRRHARGVLEAQGLDQLGDRRPRRPRHRHHHLVPFRSAPPPRRSQLRAALRPLGTRDRFEAVSLAIDWALQARTCTASRPISTRATRHRALLSEQLSFRSEGVLRERFFVGDDATDSELFGVLAQGSARGS